jgi:hypothetical protein
MRARTNGLQWWPMALLWFIGRSASADTEKVAYGNYSLDVIENRPTYQQSKKIPSCGKKAAGALASHSSVLARYSKALLVNDVEWTIEDRDWDTRSNGKAVHGTTTKDGVHISLYFRRTAEGSAWGMMFLLMKGLANQTVCMDAYELAGTFKRPAK